MTNLLPLIGSDPEFFLQTPEGELRSAIDVVRGTKEDQFMVKDGGLQHDNVAAEYSHRPCKSEDEFIAVHKSMLTALSKEVAPLILSGITSVDFPANQLYNDEALRFGCDPDMDCWLVSVNQIPADAPFMPFRSCGGHIHVGMSGEYPKTLVTDDSGYGRIELVKSMDIFVGLPSVLLDHSPESKKRRELYGRAGAHRAKEYGIEYRTLSNFWMMSPSLARLVYRLTALAAAACDIGLSKEKAEIIGPDEIQRIINECDLEAAKVVFEEHIRSYLKRETLELLFSAEGKVFDLQTEWGL